jgi:hypothetical protein
MTSGSEAPTLGVTGDVAEGVDTEFEFVLLLVLLFHCIPALRR